MQEKVLKMAVFVAVSLLIPACAEEPSQIFTGTQQAIKQGSQSHSTSKLAVAKAEFGLVKVNPQDYKVSFTPTNKVPLENETAYGWRIQLKGYQGQVTWREVYRLPKAAQNWGPPASAEFSVSGDKTQATTLRTVYTKNGVIGNTWTVSPGDPSGKHTIEVFVNNIQVGKFEFNLVS
ncbi:hypothetical protein F7734_06750 [Scytonema sp. UIC 10036]|uniref:hypothetical protein n=1 Tax=Scytonema sp. UIC 10036 TaxID=2304196 RepID=UPI0012DAC5C0|nr:hypothetical protein [Scytonema sp. UIC 10036]MUG92172.1 hypothetical protein [Scytonema sp. UIC 10036]